jgi:hypothetical protein
MSIPGELYILENASIGSVFRCFHVGLNTTTFKLTSLPHTTFDCDGRGPEDDINDHPVTCNGSSCTVDISIANVSMDQHPWVITLGFRIPTSANIQLPYTVQSILYMPPFNHSSTSYGTSSMLGTVDTFAETTSGTLGIGANGIPVDPSVTNGVKINGGISFTASSTDSQSVTTSTTASVSTGISRSDNFCVDPATCDPSKDNDHSNDTYLMLFGLPGVHQANLITGDPATLTLDYTNSIAAQFTVAELRGLAQTPQDDRVFCDAAGNCDTLKQGLALQYLPSPSDAQQLLNLDPYEAHMDITNLPKRFAPACHLPMSCAAPEIAMVGVRPQNGSNFMWTESQAHTSSTQTSTQSSTGFSLTSGIANLFGSASLLNLVSGSLTMTFADTTATVNQSMKTASVTFNNSSTCESGNVELWVDRAFGSLLYVPHLVNSCMTCQPGQQFCTMDSGIHTCGATNWTFEPGENLFWNNSAETINELSTDQHHTGIESLRISPSTDPSLPASINNVFCSTSEVGVSNLVGHTYSASVFVPNSASSYANTDCRLRAFDRNFAEYTLPASATKAPIVPGSWFQLSGTFPTNATAVYEVTIECKLPTDWVFSIPIVPSQAWYVDDISIN